VAEALEAAGGRRRLALRLHPAAIAAGGASMPGASGVAVIPDAALDPGDVLLETEAGTVDGRLAMRLTALRRALAEVAA
jgi:flagellar biosynthesis/type III secretory pathway protein FliH